MNRGQTCYDRAGRQAEYVCACEDGHVVLPIVGEDPESGEPITGDPAIWREAHDAPPPVVETDWERRDREARHRHAAALAEHRQRMTAMKAEADEARTEIAELAALAEKHGAFSAAMRWLDGEELWIFDPSCFYAPLRQISDVRRSERVTAIDLVLQDGQRVAVYNPLLWSDGEDSEVRKVALFSTRDGALAAVAAWADSLRDPADAARIVRDIPDAPYPDRVLAAARAKMVDSLRAVVTRKQAIISKHEAEIADDLAKIAGIEAAINTAIPADGRE
jgi:hypothetical protein